MPSKYSQKEIQPECLDFIGSESVDFNLEIMTTSKFGKWTLGILATILLGALGSGLWDVLLKGAFGAVGRGILTVITFGYTNLRDSSYLEIAQGRTDRASLWSVYLCPSSTL